MKKSIQSVSRHAVLKKGLRAIACAAALAVTTSTMALDNLFSWGTDPITGPTPSLGNFTPAPFLNGGNVAAVNTYLGTAAVKAIKIDGAQGPNVPSFATIYNNHDVRFTFADFEGPNQVAELASLKALITAPTSATKTSFQNNQSYLGNFGLAPLTFDPTSPTGAGASYTNYLNAGVNMANEALYPGSGGFKNPAQLGGTSSAPNIRSNLFILPIERLSLVTANMPTGHKHIPYVTRFNNWGNTALHNGVGPNGQPATYFDSGHGTANQLLSRGDFSAMVAHYRLRGADGVHLLDGGVVGYTQPQMESDANDGWNHSVIKAMYDGGGARTALLTTQIRDFGSDTEMEEIGTIASGVYSLTQNKLVLLLSNMDETAHEVTIPTKIGGKSVTNTFNIPAGTHHLLQFTGAGTQWNLQVQLGSLTQVFIDNNRNGVGVPEPTMIGGLSLLALVGLARRRRA